MDQLILKHKERYIGEQRKTREMFQKQMRQLQERRANEHRERFTRCESPSPGPIKQKATKRSKQLIIRTIHILKHPPITLPPSTAHQTQWN